MKTDKPKDARTKGQQPEALATFAATARHSGKKPDDVGLHATSRPILVRLKGKGA